MNHVFIPGNVPSSKNSKIATSKGVFHSKTVAHYLKDLGVKGYNLRYRTVDEYRQRVNIFRQSCGTLFNGIQYPAIIGFHFVRDSRRQFDFHNACQIIADLLVAHGMIEDDNMACMIPVPYQVSGRWYTVDKACPGVFLRVFKDIQMAA
ncbi:MAG TPA: hypothetical protein DCZ95_18025 [Verrucomicrobia bacterium]|nr:hypothetical protein [Verrucomicrobiota bacterium]